MTENSVQSQAASPISEATGALSSTAVSVITGLPQPIRRNAIAAFGRMCVALADIPVSWLEGKAQNIRASNDARAMLTATAAQQIALEMKVAPEFAEAAALKHAQKIVGKQVNLNRVSDHALKDLEGVKFVGQEAEPQAISSDWLNAFEDEASNMSSEEMQRLFGRILAGEIRSPTSYSIRTLKVIAQLDNRAAHLFTTLCSLSVSLTYPDPLGIQDARVLALGGDARANVLSEFGINFDALNILQEYGLIIPDYNSYMDYRQTVAQEGSVRAVFRFQGEVWALVPKSEFPPSQKVHLYGVKLSTAGRELLPIVDLEPNPIYAERLVNFFDQIGFDLGRVTEVE